MRIQYLNYSLLQRALVCHFLLRLLCLRWLSLLCLAAHIRSAVKSHKEQRREKFVSRKCLMDITSVILQCSLLYDQGFSPRNTKYYSSLPKGRRSSLEYDEILVVV